MQKLIYEVKPYFFVILGLIASIRVTDSRLALFCSALLILASSSIIWARYKNRKRYTRL